MSGRLTIAATPIGNLGDITQRLAEALAQADLVYCEDTRVSRKLLEHLGVRQKLAAYHEHSPPQVLEQMAARLEQGQHVLLISDAGTPLINDPGFEVVRMAHERGYEVDALPGPNAALNALVLSGLPCHQFAYMGYFPQKLEARHNLLAQLASMGLTSIHYESPNRLVACLTFLGQHAPDTPIAVCREMTKLHQQVIRGRCGHLDLDQIPAKGEVVLVLGPVETRVETPDLKVAYQALLDGGNSPSQSIKILAKRHGLVRRALYKQLVEGEE